MKAIWIVLPLLFISPAKAETINSSPGGLIIDFMEQVDYFRETGEEVRLMGRCDSACTLFLQLPRVCVGKRARLGFHMASNPGGTAYLMSTYSKGVRDWIKSRGGLRLNVITLEGKALRKLVRSCSGHFRRAKHITEQGT